VTTPGGAAPALVGVLYDFPQGDGGALFEDALRLGLEESRRRFDRPIELLAVHARGLPSGTAHEMASSFEQLAGAGVLAVLGPSISDNALVVQPLTDRREVPAVNYSGGERTRGAWMFHYQVGSLAEEPVVLAAHLAERRIPTVALAHDQSAVGRGYAEAFAEACAARGIELVASAAVSPLSDDLGAVVRRLRAAGPGGLCYLGLGVAARPLALAVADEKWEVPVVANSALMFGYARKDWRDAWDGWVYVDTVSDANPERAKLRQRSARSAAGPIGVAAYDMGRLLGEALERAAHLTPSGVRDGLEAVKALPAASGKPGTVMGFGPWDHGALKGPYLVLRTWKDGRSVELSQ
jgi:branched-chain amino acid transport system substrate-binding protein